MRKRDWAIGVAVVCAAIFWFRNRESVRGSDQATAGAAIEVVDARPAEVVAEAQESALRPATEIARTEVQVEPAPSRFDARGHVRSLSDELPLHSLVLTWKCNATDAGIETPVHDAQWSARFESGDFELVSARSNEGAWVIVEVTTISPTAPTCEVVLAPPGARVLDVRKNDETRSRLPVANVKISAVEVTSNEAMQVVSRRRPGGGVERSVRSMGADGPGPVSWSLDKVRIPAVLPNFAPGTPIQVDAPGYRPRTLDGPTEPGVTLVALDAARVLRVELRGELDGKPLVGVRIAEPDSTSAFRIVETRVPSSVPIDDFPADFAEVRVFALSSVGIGPTLRTSLVSMQRTGETLVVIDLKDVDPREGCKGLDVQLVRRSPSNASRPISIRVVRLDETASADLHLLDPRVEFASGWRDGPDGRECSVRFPCLHAGDYAVVVHPSLVEARVHVGTEPPQPLRLEIPALSTVKIVAKSRSGGAMHTSTPGALIWFVRDPHTNSEQRATSEASAVGQRLTTGRAAFAENGEGTWSITAAVDAHIEVHFMGPRAFGVEPLIVRMQPQSFEETLIFRGL